MHVLHQIIYLTDCYRARTAWRRPEVVAPGGLRPGHDRPVSHRHVQAVAAAVPGRRGGPALSRFSASPSSAPAGRHGFGFFLVAWIAKTVVEFREGRASVPKTLLIGITTVVSFCLPLGSNLDVLFQGYNTWHSFQYLFLLWLINRLRDQRGEIDSPFVRALVRQRSMALTTSASWRATGVIVV